MVTVGIFGSPYCRIAFRFFHFGNMLITAIRVRGFFSSPAFKTTLIPNIILPRRFYSSESASRRTTIYLTIPDSVGSLDDILLQLRKLNISLSRIESRPSKSKGFYDFYVDFTADNKPHLDLAILEIERLAKEVKVISTGSSNAESPGSSVPWFPRKISDLDTFADKVLSYGSELNSDHPGFKDPEYRKRRASITNSALTYRHGEKLPRVEYSKNEIETWGVVFRKLSEMYKTHACHEHQYIFPLLVQNCGYNDKSIPQIEDVSKFLKECTGWTLRPVMGLLSSRDFLNSLAFRVFHRYTEL